jgi:hypothetical protein
VRGEFPTESEASLLSRAWIERARLPASEEQTGGAVSAGIDVAGPGEDETALVVRQGDAILEQRAWSAADARGAVLAALQPWCRRGLTAVNVDVAGTGWYFAQHLRDQLGGIQVRGINVGESPTTSQAAERYANLKAELYWQLRERFRDGGVRGLTDERTRVQLASLRYDHDSRGRVRIESKEQARKRGVRSPDRAEALLLAFAARPALKLPGPIPLRETAGSPAVNPRDWAQQFYGRNEPAPQRSC